MLRFKILFVILILLSKISATEIVIDAMIADSVNQTGIPNVNIFIYKTSIGTITDQDGRFRLVIPERYKNSQLVISHIAYPLKMVPVVEFETHKLILLKKIPIQLREIRIQPARKNYEYRQEISNPVSVIPAETFEVKGFVDAADVLTADQSTIIDESFNGEKTISIRGANEDEVLILYDGIRQAWQW